MLHIILFEPQIPQNTGNIGRLCALTGAILHLIHPLGFTLSDKYLKRSGMDYWKALTVHNHDNWKAFSQSALRPNQIWLATTKTEQSFWDVSFKAGDGLLFGNEGAGCPASVHAEIGKTHSIKIPQFNNQLRSLNLATAVGIVAYEAIRQISNAP